MKAARALATPDIPTVSEAGVPGQVHHVVVRSDRAAADAAQHIARLNATLVGAMREREMQERIATAGAEAVSGSAAAFHKLLCDGMVTRSKVIKATGL